MGRRKSKSKHREPNNGKEIPTAVASSSAPPPPQPPPWIELPEDITANILQRLDLEEILESARKVCTTWRRVCQDPAMWRVIHMRQPGGMARREFDIMCRHAVDLSQGQLIDLSIDYFADDELLNYIFDRSRHLRCLQLDCCDDMSGEGLAEAVKKLPHLEELHLLFMPLVQARDVETIGISCPMLKSFTYDNRGSRHPLPECSMINELMEGFGCNDYALAIAKTMPNLRHLRLFAHGMKNEGLEAILDGCPHLESLDLRQCFGLDLGGDLGKRCGEQIKDLRRPSDSISDIWWLGGPSVEWEYDSGYSDIYSFDCCDNYGYHEDFEQYDDYTSPLGIGSFSDDGSWLYDDDYI